MEIYEKNKEFMGANASKNKSKSRWKSRKKIRSLWVQMHRKIRIKVDGNLGKK